MPDILWPFPEHDPTPSRPDEVHVWGASLDRSDASCAELEKLLSEDERKRARQFRFDRDRHRYIVGRGVLRCILGSYLRLPAETLKFAYGDFGKPRLIGYLIHFNVAHSDALAIYAISPCHEVGVDVEQIRLIPEMSSIAKQFFSPLEYKALMALPGEAQTDAFFNCWTRKEAYLKAGGQGLSEPLDRFDVSIGEMAELLRIGNIPEEHRQWNLTALFPAQGYKAALAVRTVGLQIRRWKWPH